MEKRDILNWQDEKIGELELPDGTSEEVWALKLSMFSQPPSSISMKELVQNKILKYRSTATQLLTEMYAENTLAGITLQQSDDMFSEYADVILRIQQGAFPSALYRLSQKIPSGFVTQELLDNWARRIRDYI